MSYGGMLLRRIQKTKSEGTKNKRRGIQRDQRGGLKGEGGSSAGRATRRRTELNEIEEI